MTLAQRLGRGLLLLVAGAAAACASDGITGPRLPSWPTTIQLVSDAGDWVGGGLTYRYDQANALITVASQGGHLSIGIDGDQWWHANFLLPSSMSRFQPGEYKGLTRYPFEDPAVGGLDWSGEGRGCNTIAGSLTVNHAWYAADTLAAIDLSFEQHCEGAAPALRGAVQWRSGDPTQPPGPVNPVPTTLWRAPAQPLPATGNYVYLASQQGDYIGGGGTYLMVDSIAVSASGGHLSVHVGDWWGDFQAMNTLELLQAGYYPGLERYPFNNPRKGGLSWYGNGRGCNELTGWFAIDQVLYSGVTLTGVDLRFEQHCEGGAPALHGQIHWRV